MDNIGEKNLKIYYTSDTHAHVVPNFLSIMNSFEKKENTLIIDGGDTIQGSPLSMYLSSEAGGCDAEPFAAILNEAGVDYVTLGNHEFNYGKKYLHSFLGNLNAKCLCANVNTFEAYDIKEISSLKVGIVGITTDHIPNWERAEHIEGYTFSDPFFSAKTALEEIKDKVDLTICLYHGGYERDVYTGEIYSLTTENIGYKICDELDFDLVLSAHQHKAHAGSYINGTYTVQPPNAASSYLEIDICFDQNKKPVFKSELKTPELVYEIPEFLKEYIKKSDIWFNQVVGKLSKPLIQGDYLDMAFNGSDIANLKNQVQLWKTNADYSATSLPNKISGLNEIVTIRDIVSTFIFPNNLVVLEVDRNIMKEILERTAAYFHYENGEISVSQSFLQPKIAHYDYDYYTFPYTIDITKPVGERVISMDIPEKFTLCLNNYRAKGTGGYEAYKKAKVVKEYTDYIINDIILQYFIEHNKVEVVDFPKVEVIK